MLDLETWLKELGISRINEKLITTALTHSSYKGMGYQGADNERLEFVGDAALDLINAELLYIRKEILSEGDMTEMRKRFVSNSKLAKTFDKLNMGDYICTANNLKLSVKIKGSFIEALFGAIFIERGYPGCKQLWDTMQNIVGKEKFESKAQSLLKEAFSVAENLKGEYFPPAKNAKSALLEFCQGNGVGQPIYEFVERKGSDHNPLHKVRVIIRSIGQERKFRNIFELSPEQKLEVFEAAAGPRKKDAEMNAAKRMCDRIGLIYSK